MVAQVEAGTTEVQEGNGPAVEEATEGLLAAPAEAAPDTGAEAAPDAEAEPTAADDTAEPTPPPDPREWLKNLTEDERRELPEVRDLLRRESESVRQRAESETQRRIAENESQWLARGEFTSDFAKAHVLDDNGNPVLDPTQGKIVDRMWNAGVLQIGNLNGELLYENVPADFPITRAEQAALEDAHTKYLANPMMHADTYLRARIAVHDRAVREAYDREMRPKMLAEARKELQSKAQTETIRAAETQAAKSTGPTATSGTSAKNYGSRAEVQAAHVRGDLSDEEMWELKNSGAFSALP